MAKQSYTTPVRIVDGQIEWADRDGFVRAVRQMTDCQAEVTVAEVEDTRSAVANRYYWGCVLREIERESGQPTEDIHDEMCDRFLKRRIVLVGRSGEVMEKEVAGRSSSLKVSEFYQFVENVRLFATEFFGVTTPDPDPEYRRHRADAQRKSEAA